MSRHRAYTLYSPIERTIVGTTIGETISARSALLPGTARRTSAMDARVPRVVASTVTITPIWRLRTVAFHQAALDQYASYQRTDSVRGANSRKQPPQNDIAITSRLGAARNAITRPVTTQTSGDVRSPIRPTPGPARPGGRSRPPGPRSAPAAPWPQPRPGSSPAGRRPPSRSPSPA